jgi:hypothetical protein
MGRRAGVDGKAEARIDQCYTHRIYLLDLILLDLRLPGNVTVIASIYTGIKIIYRTK